MIKMVLGYGKTDKPPSKWFNLYIEFNEEKGIKTFVVNECVHGFLPNIGFIFEPRCRFFLFSWHPLFCSFVFIKRFDDVGFSGIEKLNLFGLELKGD